MKNVVIRSLSGLVYIAIIVGAVLGGSWWMLALVTLLAFLAVDEFNRITSRNTLNPALRFLDLVGAALMILASFCIAGKLTVAFGFGFIVLFWAYIVIRLIAALYIKNDNPLERTACSLMGQLYIALPLSLLLLVYNMSHAVVMLMFVMIWINDTGAFCVGSLIGRHRLFERISPKKSWEGFFGGMIFAIAAGAVSYLWLGDCFEGYTLVELMIMGAVVSIFSTWGDLVESLIKRTLGIKDSGNIMPGHGGILDRIDSLLLVAPAMFFMVLIMRLF